MKKIPTVFERDWNGDRSRVLNQVHPDCQWVIDGEGTATIKLDGTCCMVRAGRLYKRYEAKDGRTPPPGFEISDQDAETGKTVGWVPVGDGPEDRWHRAAMYDGLADGTYELMGEKVRSNPNGFVGHKLVAHRDPLLTVIEDAPPRDFDGIAKWFAGRNIEGVVWHHPDGRMAKLKLRDMGLRRPTKDVP